MRHRVEPGFTAAQSSLTSGLSCADDWDESVPASNLIELKSALPAKDSPSGTTRAPINHDLFYTTECITVLTESGRELVGRTQIRSDASCRVPGSAVPVRPSLVKSCRCPCHFEMCFHIPNGDQDGAASSLAVYGFRNHHGLPDRRCAALEFASVRALRRVALDSAPARALHLGPNGCSRHALASSHAALAV